LAIFILLKKSRKSYNSTTTEARKKYIHRFEILKFLEMFDIGIVYTPVKLFQPILMFSSKAEDNPRVELLKGASLG
jgi:hypothetical protein